MNFRVSKSGLKKRNMNQNDYVHCCVIGCHGNSLFHLVRNKKVSYEGLMGGGYSILKHLYLNDYAEFDSKISYIMFYIIIIWPVKYLR